MDFEHNIYYRVLIEIARKRYEIEKGELTVIDLRSKESFIEPLSQRAFRGTAPKIKLTIERLNKNEKEFTLIDVSIHSGVCYEGVVAYYESNNIYGKWFKHPK